ncbi:MAG: O-antigen ligase family protein [Lachnospiraceae bacterium]|nr:O-antigen ligase family protein [Lachnospiraceae bacterium]
MEKIKKILIMALILLLPYHHQIIYVVMSDFGILRFWKEIVIALLVVITFIQIVTGKKKINISLFEILLIVFMAAVFVYVCVSSSKYQAMYISRIYIMPMFLVPVIKYTDITKQDLKNAIYVVMANTIIICIWGIFQAQFLGDEFLVDLGYRTQRVNHMIKLKNEFYILGGGFMQRVASTFAAPNTCGMYLAIVISIVTFLNKDMQINKVYTYITLGISAVTLLLTFSRTSWIACLAALMVHFILFVKWDKKTWKKVIICGVSAAMLVVIADILIIRSGIVMAGFKLIFNTVTGRDSSLIGHFSSWGESVIRIFKHPLGLGLGNNGPRAMKFIKKPNLTESSYFLMAYEVGILGAALYFSSYIIATLDNIRLYKETNNKKVLVILSVLIIIYLCYLSLPFIQDFEILVLTYIIVSLQYNKSLTDNLTEERIVV